MMFIRNLITTLLLTYSLICVLIVTAYLFGKINL